MRMLSERFLRAENRGYLAGDRISPPFVSKLAENSSGGIPVQCQLAALHRAN